MGMRIVYRTARAQLPAFLACITHIIRGTRGINWKVHPNFTDIAHRFQGGAGDSSLPYVVPTTAIEAFILGVHTLGKRKKEDDTNDAGNVNPQTIGSGQAFRGTGCGYFGQTLFGPERKEYSFMFLGWLGEWLWMIRGTCPRSVQEDSV